MKLEIEGTSTVGLGVAVASLAWIWFAGWFILGAALCGAL